MTKKRKISIRKLLQAFFTFVLTGTCIAAILSASKIQKSEKLKAVFLHVKNEDQYQFLDKITLLNTLKEKNDLMVNETKLGFIDLKAVEQDVYENPWVAEAQVHIDNQRNMHIYTTQHTPAARVFFEDGQSFYLNNSLKLLPTSDKFTYYTTIVTNVPWYNDDSLNLVARAKVVALVKMIEKDSFWSAQVEQISMTPDMNFEIYPVLGTHKILFGDTTEAARKLENLFGFYKNILNKIGWDKYQVLDARFSDQIVASPALQFKIPPKGFISNMDWVKTLMGAEPKEVSDTKLDLSLVGNYTQDGINESAKKAVASQPATASASSAKPEKNKPPITVKTTHSAPKTVSPKPSVTSKPSMVPANPSAKEKPKQQSKEKEKTLPQAPKKQDKPKNTTPEEKKETTQPKYILN